MSPPSELVFGWVYLPPLLVVVVFGLIAATVLGKLLDRLRWNRYFWHPPLAWLALAVLTSSLLGLLVLAP